MEFGLNNMLSFVTIIILFSIILIFYINSSYYSNGESLTSIYYKQDYHPINWRDAINIGSTIPYNPLPDSRLRCPEVTIPNLFSAENNYQSEQKGREMVDRELENQNTRKPLVNAGTHFVNAIFKNSSPCEDPYYQSFDVDPTCKLKKNNSNKLTPPNIVRTTSNSEQNDSDLTPPAY